MLAERARTGLICKECSCEVGMLCNDLCGDCHQIAHAAWTAKMAIRQDAAQFDTDKLVRALLTQQWQHECKIIPDYMPPFPRDDTRPTCTVWWTGPDGQKTGLRYSKGPAQGFFWDSYGDDMHSPELALIALSHAPPPPRIDYCIPTHGR